MDNKFNNDEFNTKFSHDSISNNRISHNNFNIEFNNERYNKIKEFHDHNQFQQHNRRINQSNTYNNNTVNQMNQKHNFVSSSWTSKSDFQPLETKVIKSIPTNNENKFQNSNKMIQNNTIKYHNTNQNEREYKILFKKVKFSTWKFW